MPAYSGERSRKSGDFCCQQCRQRVNVIEGDEIPKCPNCGNDTYDDKVCEPESESQKAKTH